MPGGRRSPRFRARRRARLAEWVLPPGLRLCPTIEERQNCSYHANDLLTATVDGQSNEGGVRGAKATIPTKAGYESTAEHSNGLQTEVHDG